MTLCDIEDALHRLVLRLHLDRGVETELWEYIETAYRLGWISGEENAGALLGQDDDEQGLPR
jgi:hypothetical protein